MKRKAVEVMKPKEHLRKPARPVDAVKPKGGVATSAANGKRNQELHETEKGLDVSRLAAELQALQRQRAWHLKSRNMVANRLLATVAGTLGYHSGMEEKDRAARFKQARELIKQIIAGEVASDIQGIVLTTQTAIDGFEKMKHSLELEMVKLAKRLPVAEWVSHPEQWGFGFLFLAIVIGETGDLANYPNPAKVWRRLGCAPWTFDGKTLMGATWRRGKDGKLPAAEWESFGYSPRRRSIAYLIGVGMVKQNFVVGEDVAVTENTPAPQGNGRNGADDNKAGDEHTCAGPYRSRYDQAKADFKRKHPDYSDLRCHLHGMLLATKLLLKNLWIEWNKGPANRTV